MATGKYQITELKKCTADYRNILGDERKDEPPRQDNGDNSR